MILRTALLLSISSFSLTAFSQIATPTIKDAKLSGACSLQNTAQILTNSFPGGNVDFMLYTFDDMVIESSNADGQRHAYKDCYIELDVELPEGTTLDTFSINYDGFMDLGEHSRGIVDVYVTIPGLTNRPWNNTKYNRTKKVGPFSADYDTNFVMEWGKLPGQNCPEQVKVYVDLLTDVKTSQYADADDTNIVAVDVLSGLLSVDAYDMSASPCDTNDNPWWSWWWF